MFRNEWNKITTLNSIATLIKVDGLFQIDFPFFSYMTEKRRINKSENNRSSAATTVRTSVWYIGYYFPAETASSRKATAACLFPRLGVNDLQDHLDAFCLCLLCISLLVRPSSLWHFIFSLPPHPPRERIRRLVDGKPSPKHSIQYALQQQTWRLHIFLYLWHNAHIIL